MTEISYKCDGNLHHITIDGHAGFSTSGMDIVCSAVSILTYTLMENIAQLDIDSETDIKEGHVSITVLVPDNLNEKLETLFNTILIGYELLEQSYPDYVRVGGRDATN